MISLRLKHTPNQMITLLKGHYFNGVRSRHSKWKANFSTSPIISAVESLASCESISNRIAVVGQIRDILRSNAEENDSDDLEPIYLRLDGQLEHLQGNYFMNISVISF